MMEAMTLFKMIEFIFCVYGISTIISSEYVFSKLVDKTSKYSYIYYMLTCNKCLSVWIGCLFSLCIFPIVHPALDPFFAYTGTVILNRFLAEKNSIDLE